MFSNNRLTNILIPVISVVLGLLSGAIIMLIFGYNPISGYAALWNGAFGDAYFFGETIVKVTPYILSGLAVAFAFRTGLFNIGVEGQVFVGWLAAVWVGTAMDLPMVIHLPLAILVAALAGGAWGFVPGFLKARFGVHEVIVSIMMNYVALYTCNALIRSVLTDNDDKTEYVNDSASLASTWLSDLTGFSRLHFGFIIAIIGAIIMWFILEKTVKGYELRAVGYNPHASKYAGMNVNRNIILSFIISGGFAGVAGAMEGLGTFQYMSVNNAFTNIGFDGIAVALLGGNAALGTVLAAFLFGTLKVGALNMSSSGVPQELVDIVVALIILFVASGYIIRWALSRFKKEEK
ncbi:ABC transporter permease [Pontibacillus marinus]|uniref:Branched-chain amino acid ABC transporter permease n=1 Tax=Pontibacillus marinus BH030004 = DSM 16465 TaxID=1385511 RepID=A0A0A5FXB6_9BACI|nr:ABC transporter permease [Pontibacillus marinus]KGX83425.1 branched-chain amino acid ABC transporter permease [Pontibacillus marinus BH030004 = DSM 16465]